MFAILLAVAMSATSSAPAASPEVRQSRNGEFMTRHYPPTALKRGEQGRVDFEIAVDRDGFLSSCEIVKSSGYANLDAETCNFLIRHAKVTPSLDSNGRTVSVTQRGFMQWQLPKGASRLASTAAAPADLEGKKICKRYPRIGSKVAMVKHCMTRQEWALQGVLVRDEVDRLQDKRVSCNQPTACD